MHSSDTFAYSICQQIDVALERSLAEYEQPSRPGQSKVTPTNGASNGQNHASSNSSKPSNRGTSNIDQQIHEAKQEVNLAQEEINKVEEDIRRTQAMCDRMKDEMREKRDRVQMLEDIKHQKRSVKGAINYMTQDFDWSKGLKERMKDVFGIDDFRLCQRG
jgi:ATP-dependent DNA helicase Q1